MLRRHTRIAFTGSLHFITTVTAVRGQWFVDDTDCQNLLHVFEDYRNRFGVRCFGYVLMPDHLHAALYQEGDGLIIPRMIHGFKSTIARNYRPFAYTAPHLWRRRYDDVPLPGPKAVRTRLEYMHGNPVRAGLADVPEAYRWSSARHFAVEEDRIVRIESPW